MSLLAAALLSGCASNKVDKPRYPHSDTIIKYQVRQFDMDVTKSVERFGADVVEADVIKPQALKYMLSRLDYDGMLAGKDDVNVVDVDIFIDYRQQFVGDGTPFPMDKMTNPSFRVVEKFYLGDELIRQYTTPVIWGSQYTTKIAPANGIFSNDVKLQAQYTVVIINTIVSRIKDYRQADADVFAFKTKGMDDKGIIAKRRYNQVPVVDEPQPTGLASKDYIPAAALTPYFEGLQNSRKKKRIDTYKALIENWINSTELYDKVKQQVLDNYQGTKSSQVDEVTWALKALAYSGLEQYRPVLEEVASQAKDEDLREDANQFLKEMELRIIQANIIHDVTTMEPSLDWQANQLSNMLRSGYETLRSRAVKVIYRQYPQNQYLLAQLARILKKEAPEYRFRNGYQEDFYAWICRVLGASKDKQYKALLDDLALNAFSGKVKNYASAASEDLE